MISYIDTKQNIWFKAKDIVKILRYIHTDQALRKHIDSENRKSHPVETKGQVRWSTFINESGFYSLVSSSKLETAKKFKHCVTSQVLPSIRKYGQYKLFDNPNNLNMFKIENETDLQCKEVQYIRRFYPEAIIIAGLGENQDTPKKLINRQVQKSDRINSDRQSGSDQLGVREKKTKWRVKVK